MFVLCQGTYDSRSVLEAIVSVAAFTLLCNDTDVCQLCFETVVTLHGLLNVHLLLVFLRLYCEPTHSWLWAHRCSWNCNMHTVASWSCTCTAIFYVSAVLKAWYFVLFGSHWLTYLIQFTDLIVLTRLRRGTLFPQTYMQFQTAVVLNQNLKPIFFN